MKRSSFSSAMRSGFHLGEPLSFFFPDSSHLLFPSLVLYLPSNSRGTSPDMCVRRSAQLSRTLSRMCLLPELPPSSASSTPPSSLFLSLKCDFLFPVGDCNSFEQRQAFPPFETICNIRSISHNLPPGRGDCSGFTYLIFSLPFSLQ